MSWLHYPSKKMLLKIINLLFTRRGLRLSHFLDLEEIAEVEDFLEDSIDLKYIENRVNEQIFNYELCIHRTKRNLAERYVLMGAGCASNLEILLHGSIFLGSMTLPDRFNVSKKA